LIFSPTAQISLMMRLAISYPGAAFPPMMHTRGTTALRASGLIFLMAS
jgi:hypothetical protein